MSQTIKTIVMEMAMLWNTIRIQSCPAIITFSISLFVPLTWVRWTKIARFTAHRARRPSSGRTLTAHSTCRKQIARGQRVNEILTL